MKLEDKKIAMIATNGFEDSELTQPLESAQAEGAHVTVISLDKESITGEHGYTQHVDEAIGNVASEDFDGLVIPGGVKNPDTLRTNQEVVSFVRGFFEQHKPVAAICHGPWLLVEADVLEGRQVTSWPSLKTDILNAGGEWIDEPVVVDQGLVTSRKPGDLHIFCEKMVEEFCEGEHQQQVP